MPAFNRGLLCFAVQCRSHQYILSVTAYAKFLLDRDRPLHKPNAFQPVSALRICASPESFVGHDGNLTHR